MTWTLAVASYAAIFSTASLVVAFLAWRSGGPHIQAIAQLVRLIAKGEDKGVGLEIGVRNRGRGDTTVSSLILVAALRRPEEKDMAVEVGLEPALGPPLPHRLLAHSSEVWTIPSSELSNMGKRGLPWEDFGFVQVITPYGIEPVKVRPPEARRLLEWTEDTIVRPEWADSLRKKRWKLGKGSE